MAIGLVITRSVVPTVIHKTSSETLVISQTDVSLNWVLMKRKEPVKLAGRSTYRVGVVSLADPFFSSSALTFVLGGFVLFFRACMASTTKAREKHSIASTHKHTDFGLVVA